MDFKNKLNGFSYYDIWTILQLEYNISKINGYGFKY